MSRFTTQAHVTTLSYEGLEALTGSDLTFGDVVDLPENSGPFVYVLLDPNGSVWYVGKSDAKTRSTGARALAYALWVGEFMRHVPLTGRHDPIWDLRRGNLDLARRYSPIVRAAARYGLVVKVADVAHTDLSGAVWEARIAALAGTLTGVESIIGGSGWEANDGTLRGDGYLWATERIQTMRESGLI